MRVSNTQPLIRLAAEAHTEDRMNQIVDELSELLERFTSNILLSYNFKLTLYLLISVKALGFWVPDSAERSST